MENNDHEAFVEAMEDSIEFPSVDVLGLLKEYLEDNYE